MRSRAERVERTELEIPTGRFIEIRVGPSCRVFHVHEHTLRASSTFFDAAMSNGWKESRERVVNLPKDDPDVFAKYVFWIYRNQLATRTTYDNWDYEDKPEYMTLAELFVLGEKLQDASFKNDVVDAITKKRRLEGHQICWAPIGFLSRYLYKNTVSGSAIR